MLPRDLMDLPVLDDGAFCRRAALLWMYERAAWAETVLMLKGQPLTLLRGQLSYSITYLAEAWGWSDSKVRRFLNAIEKQNLIHTETDQGQRVMTLTRYDLWTEGKLAEDRAAPVQTEMLGQAEGDPKVSRNKPDRATDGATDKGTPSPTDCTVTINQAGDNAPDRASGRATEGDPKVSRSKPDTNKNEIKNIKHTPREGSPQEGGSGQVGEHGSAMRAIWSATMAGLKSETPPDTLEMDARLSAFLGEHLAGDLSQWATLCRRVREGPGTNGEGAHGFVAQIEWVTKPTNFQKINRGDYDPPANDAGRNTGLDDDSGRNAARGGERRSRITAQPRSEAAAGLRFSAAAKAAAGVRRRREGPVRREPCGAVPDGPDSGARRGGGRCEGHD
ncbi:MAG: hypothetical protein Alpg2KO_00170 [Alphaproteobacteria bacterium]